MKQMKFFLVALMTLAMGMSVTSCMKGEDNTQVNDQPFIGKVKDNFMGILTFTSLDGSTNFKVKNMLESAINFSSGDFIIAFCSYDTEVDVDAASNTINVTVGGVEEISGNEVVSTTKAEDEGENAPHKSNRGIYSASYYQPSMIDNNNLLVTLRYFANEKRDEHSFKMIYYTDDSEMKGKTELKIYLRHTSKEDLAKETYMDFVYRVFDISGALNAFKQANDKYPAKIVIETEANSVDAKVPTKTTPVSFDYTFKE